MAKGYNRKPKSRWSKYVVNHRGYLVHEQEMNCEHDWQPAANLDGWEQCAGCELMRMVPGHLDVLAKRNKSQL